MKESKDKMQEAIALAFEGMRGGSGGPFGAVVVKDGEVIGRGFNSVLKGNDPTAHAEIEAIRAACKHLGDFQLTDCVLYTSCEPCPMCLGAIYWARPAKVIYACDRADAKAVGFDDDHIYQELKLPMAERKIPFEQSGREEALKAFDEWEAKDNKMPY